MKMKKQLKGLIIICLIIALLPISVFAEAEGNIPPSEAIESVDSNLIHSFSPLPADVALQALNVGSAQESIKLPGSLTAENEQGMQIEITDIRWIPNKTFSSNVDSAFTYTPILPEPYRIETDTLLPTITVKVQKISTTVLDIRHSLSQTAGKKLSNTIAVTPGYSRLVHLQLYDIAKKKWTTKSSFRTSATHTSQMTITYPKAWYSDAKTIWRIYIPATGSGQAYASKSVAISAKRVYQNPKGWLQIQNKPIKLKSKASYNLTKGTMGLKVSMVHKKLKMGNRRAIIDSATTRKVKRWQRQKKLPATGIVKLKDWKKMGFSEKDWYEKGAYVSPLKTNMTSTRTQCVNAMISNAKRYLGTKYVIGAAGKPKTGIDCSGLVMQSMYAAGVDPKPVSVIRHAKKGYEYESRNLWKDKRLKTVPYAKKKAGDLIFYQKRGVVIHVAIYIGNGKVIESWPNKVVIWPIKNSRRSNIKGVKRVFY